MNRLGIASIAARKATVAAYEKAAGPARSAADAAASAACSAIYSNNLQDVGLASIHAGYARPDNRQPLIQIIEALYD